MSEAVNHPPHYNAHPSGVECITIVEHYNFNIGNAIKYIWRAGLKSANPIEDLKKAVWYLNREIGRLEKEVADAADPVNKWICPKCGFTCYPSGPRSNAKCACGTWRFKPRRLDAVMEALAHPDERGYVDLTEANSLEVTP